MEINSSAVAPFCIYTIRHSKDLNSAFKEGRQGTFMEMTNWKSGRELLIGAREHGLILPVIFAAAEAITTLLYWARVTDIQIKKQEKGFSTTYWFDMLTRIKEQPSKTTLHLKSTGRGISEKYIRPYAVCYTPAYISG